MFLLAALIWIGLGSIPLARAVTRRSEPGSRSRFVRALVVLGLDLLVLVAVNVFFGIATELWWFAAVGFSRRFWTEYSVRIVLFLVGAVAGALLFGFGLRAAVPRESRPARTFVLGGGLIAGGVVVGLLANSLWQPLLLFISRTPTGTADPIFGLDLVFYLFTLPLGEAARGRFVSILVAYLLTLGVVVSLTRAELRNGVGPLAMIARDRRLRAQAEGALGAFLLISAYGSALAIPELMYSGEGAVTGVGWLEANLLVPINIVLLVVLASAALLLLFALVNERPLLRLLSIRAVEPAGKGDDAVSRNAPAADSPEGEPADAQGSAGDSTSDAAGAGSGGIGELRLTSRSWVAPVAVIALLVLAGGIVPGLVRSLVLDPNEITLEAPYLPHHIGFTRDAFGVNDDNVSQTQYTAGRDITAAVLEANEPTIDNIRLWDSRALQDNLEQQQEIRLYYEFHDVDIDRYVVDGELRQMMLSVRELEKSRLAEESQTWVSRHFKYTHGYGLVALPVHEFLPQGRPNLLVRNIPPETQTPRFEVTRPEIYYGERTNDHIYVRTTQQEFDYPSGNRNVYADYAGNGGVPIGGALRRIAFAWRIDGYRQLFSGYFTPDSRIMFRRSITERARTIAPFLRYDRDPYPVVTEDGRIVYIIDAYTTSAAYPYSQPYAGMLDGFRGVNYIRNSVKVVVDAYDGSIDFYVVTPDDPIISAFARIFPDLFTPIDQMPEDLKAHVRYPADLLTVQAEMYSVYHMTDTQVFYQREDVWEFATERYRANFQPVEPYYVMLQYPNSEEIEFVLMLPFTPSNKNVINAWVAGRSDYEHYGEITVYTLPKGVEVLGPRQIEARIDQNTEMSRALSLWGQRGSEVIRGNLLAIPLFNDEGLYILYVEPIYLQAEDAALPEIKRVALADQSRVVWDEEFDTAVDRLLGRLPATAGGEIEPLGQDTAVDSDAAPADVAADATAATETEPRPEPPSGASREELLRSASQALSDYRGAVGDGRYTDAGEALERLESALDRLTGGP